jgi:hypothetical protein
MPAILASLRPKPEIFPFFFHSRSKPNSLDNIQKHILNNLYKRVKEEGDEITRGIKKGID